MSPAHICLCQTADTDSSKALAPLCLQQGLGSVVFAARHIESCYSTVNRNWLQGTGEGSHNIARAVWKVQ